MPQKIHEFPSVPEILPIRAKSPYARWVAVDIGVLSILFSYGRPVAFEYLSGIFVLESVSKPTQKHINAWRDYNRQTKVDGQRFDSALIGAISVESTNLKEGSTTMDGAPNLGDPNELADIADSQDAYSQELTDLDDVDTDEDEDDPDEDIDYDEEDEDEDEDDDDSDDALIDLDDDHDEDVDVPRTRMSRSDFDD